VRAERTPQKKTVQKWELPPERASLQLRMLHRKKTVQGWELRSEQASHHQRMLHRMRMVLERMLRVLAEQSCHQQMLRQMKRRPRQLKLM